MRVAAIILAAGGSTRFRKPKQLAIFRGETLVRRAVAAASGAECSPIIVVAGSETAEIEAKLTGTSAIVIENVNWREGLSSSVRLGIQQLQADNSEAAVLLACDQPLVDAALIRSLVQRAHETGQQIVASAYSNTLGIPALFRSSEFAALLVLGGDHGAKVLINSDLGRVATVDFPAGATDVDTPSDLAHLETGGSRPPGAIST